MGFRKSILLILAILAAGLAARSDAQSNPSAFTTGYRYDADRRLTGTIEPDPDGPSQPLHYPATRNTYDDAGRLVRVEKGELAAWQPETVAPKDWTGFTILQQADTDYDVLDQKTVERVSGLGTGETGPLALKSLTQTGYDLDGRVDCVAVRMDLTTATLPGACTPTAAGPNGADRITKNIYDEAGQLLQVRRAVGTSIEQAYATYHYTPNGHQDVMVDANGNRAEMHYDGLDRQDRWTFPSQTRPASFDPSTPANALATAGAANVADYEAYTYDANGNRLTLKKRDNTTIQYSYDELNRVYLKTVPASATGAPGYLVYQGYDNRGLLLYARFGSAAGAGISNAYDNAGRRTSETNNMDGVNRTFGSEYDADGNRIQMNGDQGFNEGFNYDGLDRMTAVREVSPTGAPIAWFTYDQLGRRSGLSQGYSTPVSATGYAYDGASRLQSQTHDFITSVAGTDQVLTFGYNPASQIVSRDRTNAAWEFTEQVPGSKSYLTNGLNQYQQAGSVTFGYDLNGNLNSDGTNTYVYDAENRLVSVGLPNQAPSVTLAYDPLGRLWQYSGPTSGTLRFLHDGDRLAMEEDVNGAKQRVYAWGPGVDEPLVWYEFPGGVQPYFLHADHQGSIVGVTGLNGNTVAIDKYDEWGVPAQGNLGRFQYTGQAWLPDLGLYYYKARIYSSRLGRFLQTDPIGYKDQVNLYAYVGNDPVDGRDPSGLAGSNDHFEDVLAGRVPPAVSPAQGKAGAVVLGKLVLLGGVAAVVSPAAARFLGRELFRSNGTNIRQGTTTTNKIGLGPHAGESIPARSPARDFTAGERQEINRIGSETGCHSCGNTSPGTKSGNFVPDHQPASSVNPPGNPQRLYPQCLKCSQEQGLELARRAREKP